MNAEELKTIEALKTFLAGAQAVIFEVNGTKDSRYRWIERTLKRFAYKKLGKADKGVVIAFLIKVSGYSRQQITRLIEQYIRTRRLKHRQRTTNGFARRYTATDVQLLAEMDERHHQPNGVTMKKLCERAFKLFGDVAFERLASISVSHLYNLRRSVVYRRYRRQVEKTRPRVSLIGERRKPSPEGRPGYIRIDTVHQGDQDKTKGVYYLNAVDEVTQWEIVVAVERISEIYLIPALEELLAQFPFRLRGFHADNGSEYVNKQVAELLDKLRIEFTRSRPRKSNDNALVESKNGAVVRKLFGHGHIPQRHAGVINTFNREHLNPYLNFHRPCFFPVTTTDERGKETKRYPYDALMTPYEKLKSLPKVRSALKVGQGFGILDAIARRMSDNEAADRLSMARRELFNVIQEQSWKRA